MLATARSQQYSMLYVLIFLLSIFFLDVDRGRFFTSAFSVNSLRPPTSTLPDSIIPRTALRAFRDMVRRHDLDASEERGNVSWVRADLRVPSETVAGTKKAVEWAGGAIDVLVNNAGICILEEFMDISCETFDETMAVNLRAPFLVSQVGT